MRARPRTWPSMRLRRFSVDALLFLAMTSIYTHGGYKASRLRGGGAQTRSYKHERRTVQHFPWFQARMGRHARGRRPWRLPAVDAYRAHYLRAALPSSAGLSPDAPVRTSSRAPAEIGDTKMTTHPQAIHAKALAFSLATFFAVIYLACLALALIVPDRGLHAA